MFKTSFLESLTGLTSIGKNQSLPPKEKTLYKEDKEKGKKYISQTPDLNKVMFKDKFPNLLTICPGFRHFQLAKYTVFDEES